MAAPGYWDAVQKAAEDMRGRCATAGLSALHLHARRRALLHKGQEKDWGLMRVKTGEHVRLTLDFERGLVSFELNRMVRGKNKQTIAEIPGLFASATVVACFGGRDQQLSIASCTERKSLFGSSADGGEGASAPRRKVRDVFNDALSGEKVEPVPFTAPAKTNSYDAQIRDMAATMETSM